MGTAAARTDDAGMTQTTAFTVPLLPGKTEIDRREMTSCWNGARKAAHDESRRRKGITRHAVWIQRAPAGDVAVVLMEADDLERAFAGIGASQEPFDVWFREHVLEVHGIDVADGMEPPEQVLDYRA